MKTVTVCIGNSDNKLTQEEWHKFWDVMDYEIERLAREIYFSGSSVGTSLYQNACWVFSIENDYPDSIPPTNYITPEIELISLIKSIREHFKQDSVAIVIGDTQFI